MISHDYSACFNIGTESRSQKNCLVRIACHRNSECAMVSDPRETVSSIGKDDLGTFSEPKVRHPDRPPA